MTALLTDGLPQFYQIFSLLRRVRNQLLFQQTPNITQSIGGLSGRLIQPEWEYADFSTAIEMRSVLIIS